MISFLVLEWEEEEDSDPSRDCKHRDQPEDESPRYLADEGSADEGSYAIGGGNNRADDTWNISRRGEHDSADARVEGGRCSLTHVFAPILKTSDVADYYHGEAIDASASNSGNGSEYKQLLFGLGKPGEDISDRQEEKTHQQTVLATKDV